MPLSVPAYLEASGIPEVTIRYKWDDWDVEESDMPLDDALQERLHGLSKRAAAAFTIGTAEWIVYRFRDLSDSPAPAQLIEAAWAQVIDLRYSSVTDISPNEWIGPVWGPIGVALRRVVFALEQAHDDGDPGWRAGRASNLAEHVISDPAPYREWRERTLERIGKLYPLDPNETLGEVVPREAMDPAADFLIPEAETLVNNFLSTLDYTSNPFLCSPEEMLRRGFAGTPYVFSLDKDRKARYEW